MLWLSCSTSASHRAQLLVADLYVVDVGELDPKSRGAAASVGEVRVLESFGDDGLERRVGRLCRP
ncbi:hypothetical protein AB0L80_41770 [Streptomyces sp. NPDC052069]|uniref:hypothetical protein n=1 Tax=unclassified Streptomyces TaxID=2593676 RepID=UPI0034146998